MSVQAFEDTATAPAPAPRFGWARAVVADPMGALGLFMVLLVIAAALLADLSPYSPAGMNPKARFSDPSLMHWFGTDHLGRDLFTRVLYGARIALFVALVSTRRSRARC